MIEYMLAKIICREFENVVYKGQYKSGKAMHIGFRMATKPNDQYLICHMYIFAPCNYVHVATQEELMDGQNERHIKSMEHLCYHDSCWRDTVQRFIINNSTSLEGFQSLFKLFDWYDVVKLTEEERKYLSLINEAKDISEYGSDSKKEQIKKQLKVNPFDKRSVWYKE